MPVPLLRWAIRRRHSAVDEERGGRVVARHILQRCVNKTSDSIDIHGAICHEIHCFLNESGLGGNLPLPAHTNIECQDYLYFVLNIKVFYCILIP